MSKPGKLSKLDIFRWLHAFAAYLLGGLLTGIGMTLEHLNVGIWTYILVAVGGALVDLGRRFISDTQARLLTQTTVTSTDSAKSLTTVAEVTIPSPEAP